MKKTHLLVGAALLSCMAVLGATAEAATYTGGQAATNSTITLIEPEVPTKPNGPSNDDPAVIPGKPGVINQDTGKFLITYASDLNFGKHQNKGNAIKAFAQNETIAEAQKRDDKGNLMFTKDANDNDVEVMTSVIKYNEGAEASKGTDYEYAKIESVVTPFVGTKDMRSDENGWTLTAIQTPFVNGDKKEIRGAAVTFDGLNYAVPTTKEGMAPTATASSVTLSTTAATEIARTGQGLEKGKGIWSLSLGNLGSITEIVDENKNTIRQAETTDISLTVPGGQALDNGTYSSTITYELAADPSVVPTP